MQSSAEGHAQHGQIGQLEGQGPRLGRLQYQGQRKGRAQMVRHGLGPVQLCAQSRQPVHDGGPGHRWGRSHEPQIEDDEHAGQPPGAYGTHERPQERCRQGSQYAKVLAGQGQDMGAS